MAMEVSRRSFLSAATFALAAFNLPDRTALADEPTSASTELKTIVAALPEGDFKSKAGFKISINREEGIERLYKLSETEKKEVSAIYVPSEKVWIATSLEGKEHQITSDMSYAEAFLKEGVPIEMVHIHIEPDLTEVAPEHQLFWVVPSPSDMNQILHYGAKFDGDFTATIVCKYGTLSYGCKDYTGMNPVGANIYFQKMLRDGASHMQMAVRGIESGELSRKLNSYKGIMALTFTQRETDESK